MKTHEGRVAIITGAGRGIGQALARALAERGATLVLVDLEAPLATRDLLGGQAISVAMDVASDAGWRALAAKVDDAFGRADIVVNNAGHMVLAPFAELTEELWRRTMAVNLDAHFLSAKHFVPRMRANRWGRFVHVSSNSIALNSQGMSHYMASKMGVLGFVRGLANEVGADGITVNAILPSLTNTPATAAMPDEFKREVWERQAIKRLAEPGDLTGPVAFLTSDDAAFVTGQALVADGGLYKIS